MEIKYDPKTKKYFGKTPSILLRNILVELLLFYKMQEKNYRYYNGKDFKWNMKIISV